MTRDEVKQLLMTLDVTYSNFKLDPTKLSFTVNSWLMFLEPYSWQDIQVALKTFINTSNSPFAPAPSELIGLINTPNELAEIEGAKAWDMVRKAIGRSTYNSLEEFNKLPPEIQRAVGSAETLHCWATNEYYSDSTTMKEFLMNYNTVLKRDRTEQRLPAEAKMRLEQIRKDKVALLDNNAFLIGQKTDKLQEGDFEYEIKRPDEETLGRYAEQLRKDLGVE